MILTGDELKVIFEREGVTPLVLTRGNKRYLYVTRWIPGPNKNGKMSVSGGHTQQSYVGSLDALKDMTENELMKKINSLTINPNKAHPKKKEPKAYDLLAGDDTESQE